MLYYIDMNELSNLLHSTVGLHFLELLPIEFFSLISKLISVFGDMSWLKLGTFSSLVRLTLSVFYAKTLQM